MSRHHEYLHQKSRIIDYRDQVANGLFQMHRILTSYFPSIDVIGMGKIKNLLDDEIQQIIDKLDGKLC